MLVQEPLQASIWHCLNHFDHSDAIFLAELLFNEVRTDESLHLLATCYYRSGRLHQAYDLLRLGGGKSGQNRFLLAKCCADLKNYSEAERVLLGECEPRREVCSVDDMVSEFGESAPFAFLLLGQVYGRTDRVEKAIKCEERALELNPFLWGAFESLCDRGQSPDAAKVFNVNDMKSFNQCHGVNPILNLVNNPSNVSLSIPPRSSFPSVTSTPNINLSTPQPLPPSFQLHTPVNPVESSVAMDTTTSDVSTFSTETPRNIASAVVTTPMSGVMGPLNYSTESGGLPSSEVKQSAVPIVNAPIRRRNRMCIEETPNMVRRIDTNTLTPPKFGLLPRTAMAQSRTGDGGVTSIALKLDFSSPGFSVLSSVMSSGTGESPCQGLDKGPVKLKRTAMATKENPPKPNMVLGQSSTNAPNQNITPSQGGNQIVRRSSRLFGSTQSVKENSKAPTKKSRPQPQQQQPQNSPSRKPKGRQALTPTQSELAEKNERNKAESPQSDDSLKKPAPPQIHISYADLGAQALVIQKQSVDGLMQLLRQMGLSYQTLAKYQCHEAIKMLENLPPNHNKTGWVLGLLGKAHFELGNYIEAKSFFKLLREREPFRFDFMEYYSTTLWHLQEDVELSALAQDLTRSNKNSPQAWCAAGNCFSHLKEHENAIKFFKRAGQVDPDFAYSYTLLGHEYIMIEELDQALACFRTAVRLDPRHYIAWYGIGQTYYKQERYQLAEMYYRRALAINPSNPILMCHVAVVQHALHKTDKALETLNVAIRQAPKNSLCKFERASILFSTERYQEALQELNELKEIIPKESPVYFMLGKVHSKLNNTHMALMHFSWAMDLDPKGANSQSKEALNPALNRVTQEETAEAAQADAEANRGEVADGEELMQTDDQDMTDSFNPQQVEASTSQESLDASSNVPGQ